MKVSVYFTKRLCPTNPAVARALGNPLASPMGTQSGESRAGSARGSRGAAGAVARQEPGGPSRRSADHAAPLATRLLLEGGSR